MGTPDKKIIIWLVMQILFIVEQVMGNLWCFFSDIEHCALMIEKKNVNG